MGFALIVLALLLVFAVWYVHGEAIGLLWKTRHMTDEEAARWMVDDALTEGRESPADSPLDEREHDQ